MDIKGDSFQLLPKYKNGTFDLILTDPPYDFDTEEKAFLHREFERLASAIIVFAPPENQWVTPVGQYLFWLKSISTKNTSLRYSRFVEMIFCYGNLKWNRGRHWSQYSNVFMDLVDTTEKHSHRKPPSLIERLILNHTTEGDHILDPFAGSGVVGEVGRRLNRKVTLIDIE